MTTVTVLDEAEQRLSASLTDTQQTQQDATEAMRDEIGRQHHKQAKEELEKLERVIAEEIRPYLSWITGVSAKAPTPLPQYVVKWIQEMDNNSQTVPPFIREGLVWWKELRVPLMADGRRVDGLSRSTLIDQTRRRLMNWNGHESRFRDLKAQVENYRKESGWPARQPIQEA
jgi:hypothetical protein